MGLRLQETCCSSQVLKPWRLDQETSEEKLFIKARQKLDKNNIYRDLMNEARQKLNLSRDTKLEFLDLIFGPNWCVCVGFFSHNPRHI